jgi:hypothetical protein
MKRILAILFIAVITISCRDGSKNLNSLNQPKDFDISSLRSDMIPVKRISGQLLYLPVYSNVPYQIDTMMFDMSAFVAVHNTNPVSPIYLTQVLYFNQEGKLVDNFLKDGSIKVNPFATKNYYIPYEDKSGTGANFLIEWIADSAVYEPLIESVTINLKPNSTVAILSQGKIIRERY